MKSLFFLFYSSCLALPLHAELQRTEEPPRRVARVSSPSLDGVTRTVLAENPSLKAARAKWEGMKARVPQAAAWEDLSVSFSARVGRFVSVSPNAFTDNMLTVEQKVPLNGKNISRARAASAEAVTAYEELRRTELDLVAKTAAAYYKLANAYVQLDLNRQNENLLREFADLSRLRYEVGTQTQADVLTATIERTKLVEARADLERSRADAESALNVLMNQPARTPLGAPVAIASVAPHRLPPAARLEELALAFRPEVRVGQKRIDAAQARLQLARRDWVPDPAFRVTGQQYNAASQAVSEVDVGVTFTVPWLNYGKYRAQTREMRAGVAQAAQELERLQTETLGLVRDQLTKIRTFHHHYEVYRDTILPLARQAVAANRSGYQGSKSSFLELIAAERTLRDAEAESQMHLADYHTAVAELAAVVGVDFHTAMLSPK